MPRRIRAANGGTKYLEPGVINPSFRLISPIGEMTRNGYYYRIYLPTATGQGVLELADVVGLDIGLSVLGTLGGEDAKAEAEFLKGYVDAGKLGKKTGEGFYTWEKGKAQKGDSSATPQQLHDLAKRLLQPYFDECEAALADGIVDDGDVLDAGMVFGTGFAPFRGGPLNYLATLTDAVAVTPPPTPEPSAEPEADEPPADDTETQAEKKASKGAKKAGGSDDE